MQSSCDGGRVQLVTLLTFGIYYLYVVYRKHVMVVDEPLSLINAAIRSSKQRLVWKQMRTSACYIKILVGHSIC